MSLQILTKTDVVPPGKYRFTVPETGYVIDSKFNQEDLFDAVKNHYNANNIDLPDNWKELVIDQMCRQLPAGWCHYSDGKPAEGIESIMSFDNILKGIVSLTAMATSVIKDGETPFVEQDEAEARANICSRCFYNKSAAFCMGCGGASVILDMVGNVKGKRTTSLDGSLQNCGICGCRNDAIVHVKKKLLLKGENQDITNKRPDWCWLKNDNTADASLKLHL